MCIHGITPNLWRCWADRVSGGGGGGLGGALPSLAVLTLGCLSTLATNEIDPGAVAPTEAPPFTEQGPNVNQTGAKYRSSCTQKEKL